MRSACSDMLVGANMIYTQGIRSNHDPPICRALQPVHRVCGNSRQFRLGKRDGPSVHPMANTGQIYDLALSIKHDVTALVSALGGK